MLALFPMDWFASVSGEQSSLLCAFFWAIAIILFRRGGEQVSPFALNVFKNVVALGLFLATMGIAGIPLFARHQPSEDWIVLLLSGAVGIGLADTLFFASLNRIGAGRMALLDCCFSPLVALCSFFYLGERVGGWVLVAMGLMLAAILLGASGFEKTEKFGGRAGIRKGILLGLLAMLLTVMGFVYAKPVLERSNLWWVTAVRLIGGLALLFVQGCFRKHQNDVARVFRPQRLWWVILPSAVLGNYLAVAFWMAGVKYAQTTVASLLYQLSTIFILILATVFLKEPLSKRKGIAILLGFVGGVVATW